MLSFQAALGGSVSITEAGVVALWGGQTTDKSSAFARETPNGYQQDLFEKIIPIGSGEGPDTRFEIPIEFKEPVAEVGHELPDRQPSFLRRVAQAVSSWLRKG